MIKMPMSEIADRYSICLLKHKRTSENMTNEINLYKKEIDSFGSYGKNKSNVEVNRLKLYIKQLYFYNGQIWDLEADIRRGREKELGLEEVGRRAIKIRGINKQRIAIKNKIVELTGEGFTDIKINHGSD